MFVEDEEYRALTIEYCERLCMKDLHVVASVEGILATAFELLSAFVSGFQ